MPLAAHVLLDRRLTSTVPSHPIPLDHEVAFGAPGRHGGVEPRRVGGSRGGPRPLPRPGLQEERRGGGPCPRQVGSLRSGVSGFYRDLLLRFQEEF